MKNILLPTDLSVQSLWPIHNIIEDAKDEKVTVHVVHLLCLPTSISDLLYLREPYNEVPENFSEALELLRNKYASKVQSIKFQFLYCTTSRYLNNFIEAKGIDEVFMLMNYNYEQTLSTSESCLAHFKKCKVPVRKLPLHPEAFSEYQILSALLNGGEQNVSPEVSETARPVMSFS